MFDIFSRPLRQKLNTIKTALPEHISGRECIKTGTRYQRHYFDGRINHVPKDCRFSRVGALDAWQQCWIDVLVQNLPLSRNLKDSDLQFLDKIPLGPEEMQRQRRMHKIKQQLAIKIYSDLVILMNYITNEVSKKGGLVETVTVLLVGVVN